MHIGSEKISGERPKVSPGLLSPDQAQIASNANVGRGDLRAWRAPERVSTLDLTTVQTVFQYEENDNTSWVEYATIVDYILSPIAGDQYERVYFTGGDTFEPRFFANNLPSGDFDFTTDYLKLGIPAPTEAPTVTTSGGGSTYRAYVYCYVNSYGDQGGPCSLGSESDFDTGYVEIGNILDAPADRAIDKIYLYRTNSDSYGIAEFQFVCEATWFSASVSYAIGDYVIYSNGLYRCTSTHAAGAWDAGDFTSGENVSDDDLGEVIPSYYISGSDIVTYDPPPDDLDGIIILPNGVAAGFVGNQLYLSEPYHVHAWPTAYSIGGFGGDIVGLGFFGTSIVVLTNGFPYIVFGTHPSSMSKRRYASNFPCRSRRSIDSAKDSVFYSSVDGLISVNQDGAINITENIMDKDNWTAYGPESIHGKYYSGKYFGFNTSGGVVIDFVNNEITTLRITSNAEYISHGDGKLYIVANDTEAYDENDPPENIPLCVKEWEGSDINYLLYTWISKEFIMESMVNFGFVQILADQDFYDTVNDLIDLSALNATQFAAGINGALGLSILGTRSLGGDDLIGIGNINISNSVIFKLYADNELKFTKTVSGLNNIFALPKGFAGKRYYYELSGYIPIKPPVRIAPTREELSAYN